MSTKAKTMYMGKIWGISSGHKAVCKYALQTGVKLFLSGGLLSSDRGLSQHTFPTLEEGEPHQKKSMPLSKARFPASHKVEKKEKVTDFMKG